MTVEEKIATLTSDLCHMVRVWLGIGPQTTWLGLRKKSTRLHLGKKAN